MVTIKQIKSKIVLSFALCAVFQMGPVWAGIQSDLLEKAIYTEETVGDLDSAIALYREIITHADKSDTDVATAMYRLSVCYQLQGDTQKSTELLTQLIREHPDQTSLLPNAKALLHKLNLSTLNLLPEPWVSGEEMQYSLYLPTGRKMGTVTSFISALPHNGVDAWKFESTIVGGNQLYMSSIVNKDNFLPISSMSKSPQFGGSNIDYGDKSISAHYVKKGEKTNKETKIDKAVFDVSQLGALVRRLPLTENYSVSTALYQGLTNQILDVVIHVEKKENVILGEDHYDCYKVKAVFSQGGIDVQSNILWVVDNDQRQIIKSDDGSLTSILDRVVVNDISDSLIKRDYKELGFSISSPLDRQAIDMTFKDKSVALALMLVEPGFSSPILLTMITPETDNDSAEMRIPKNKVKYHLTRIRKKADESTVRENAFTNFFVDGEPAEGFVVDLKKGKKEIVSTKLYFKKGDNLFYFSSQMPKNKFDKGFIEFKEIISSFKFI